MELAVREIGRRGAQKFEMGTRRGLRVCRRFVEALFSEAVGRNFEVVVVDSAPAFAGRRLLHALYAKRVRTTYVRLTAAAPEIERATLVVLGADAVFSNGSVLARSGAFAVAALAQRRHVPVFVTCDAYKATTACAWMQRTRTSSSSFLLRMIRRPLTHLTYDVTFHPCPGGGDGATILPPAVCAIRELAESRR